MCVCVCVRVRERVCVCAESRLAMEDLSDSEVGNVCVCVCACAPAHVCARNPPPPRSELWCIAARTRLNWPRRAKQVPHIQETRVVCVCARPSIFVRAASLPDPPPPLRCAGAVWVDTSPHPIAPRSVGGQTAAAADPRPQRQSGFFLDDEPACTVRGMSGGGPWAVGGAVPLWPGARCPPCIKGSHPIRARTPQPKQELAQLIELSRRLPPPSTGGEKIAI